MAEVAARDLQQSRQSGTAAACPDSFQSLVDQPPVVFIQRHQVGDGSQRNQIQPAIQPRLLALLEPAFLAQTGAQCHQGIEHHPDSGQRTGRERIIRKVRIDDGVGLRQRLSRQMVIGNDDPNTQPSGQSHAVD